MQAMTLISFHMNCENRASAHAEPPLEIMSAGQDLTNAGSAPPEKSSGPRSGALSEIRTTF